MLDKKNVGCQSRSAVLRMASAANLGFAATSIASAPDCFEETICESSVGSVTS